MDFAQNKKNILILAGIVFAGILYYVFFVAPANSTVASLDEAISAQLQQKTQNFFSYSTTLDSLHLDVTIANQPALLDLVSYQYSVPEQTVGKSNLFDEPATAVIVE